MNPTRDQIRDLQLKALRKLTRTLAASNRFYRPRLEKARIDPDTVTLESFSESMPLTMREEWVYDQVQNPPYGTNLTYDANTYTRLCRTSGSTGQPMNWLDTQESWTRMLNNWCRVFRACDVTDRDTIFCAFSFGPFLGFWTAYEAAHQMGCLTVPGGGLSSLGRLNLLIDCRATVLLCTPTYAIHLAQEARRYGVDLKEARIRTIVVAGEPGGSISATRSRISALWRGAKVFDHHGMTEVGPVSYPCPARTDVLHVMETSFYPEIIDPETGAAASEGELILTTLARIGSPLLRYRTGDRVKAAPDSPCACGTHELGLEGGILGRDDDMVIVRGINVFPGAVENILRQFPEIVEYRVRVYDLDAMKQLCIQIELQPDTEEPEVSRHKIEKQLQSRLSLRVPVEIAEAESLPRFEMKSKRWMVHGKEIV